MTNAGESADAEVPSSEPIVIRAVGIPSAEAVGTPTIYLIATFADRWYADAIDNAKLVGRDARRREITFAVACAESFLFEWVRDVVLLGELDKLEARFPRQEFEGIRDKWKRVVKELHIAGKIPSIQEFGQQTWADFAKLVAFRNGLVHANASRPEIQGVTPPPVPTLAQLDALAPGWACAVVVRLIDDLLTAAGFARPAWLVDP